MAEIFQKLASGATTNAIGDYSGLAKNFVYTVPDTVDHTEITRLIISYQDTGAFDGDGYGAGATLSNGINIKIIRDNETVTIATGILTNLDWGTYTSQISYITFDTGNKCLSITWCLAAAGKTISLWKGEKISVELEDDFSGLTKQTFLIEGVEYP